MIPGTKIQLDGQELVVPPLNLRQLRQHRDALLKVFERKNAIAGSPEFNDALDALITVAHAALSRNYPELTLDQVGEALDVSNVAAVLSAAVGAGPVDNSRQS